MNRRSLVPAVRLAVLAVLVAAPALAQPPHSPTDQYESFDRQSPVIVDRQTRLVWERSIPSTTETWTTADAYCRLTFGGRLPTVKELLTLFDEEPHEEYTDMPFQVHIDPDAFGYRTPVDAPYWTSTPANGQGTQVWTLDFEDGAMAPASTADRRHYRCVRPKP